LVETLIVQHVGGAGHAGVSLWLNAGVSPQDLARWRAGHSVEVLLRVYAKCLHGGEAIANNRIEAALKDV